MAKVLEGPGMGLMKKWGIVVPNFVVVSLADELGKLGDAHDWLKKSTLVVKAHEALGSRFKLGLVKVGLDLKGAQAAAKEMLGRQVGSITVSQVIVSEMVPHTEEYYVAVKSTRAGAEILLANCGGIEVESNWDRVKKLALEVGDTPSAGALEKLAKEAGFTNELAPKVADFAGKLFACFDNEDAQYLEVNPMVVRESDGQLVALDAVTLLDADARFRHPDWNFPFAAEFGRAYTKNELEVMAVDAKIKGSVKFIEIPGGDTAMLPAGGGASVYYFDAVVARGGKLANYTEYSGDLPNKGARVVIHGGAAGLNAARRMAEFCYMIKRPLNVEAFVYQPDTGKTNEVPYGSGLLTIPVYKSVADATAHHSQINTSLVYIGADRACAAGMEALNDPKIQVVSMITEGVPEKDAKLLARHATKLGKIFNGPSSIGVISAGECRLGVIGGAFDNLVACKLYREGSFGVITKSGGLSNEIIWICSQFADGITTAIGIGGDAYPGTDYVTYLEMFEQDPQTKAVVIVGEMGGELEERAAEWFGAKKRRIKLLAVVSGFCQESLPKGMKFGHAGAKEGMKGEGSARSKADAFKKAGATVPETFGALGPAIKATYEELVKSGLVRPIPDLSPEDLPKLPKTVEEGMRTGEVMVAPLIKTTISDDRGDEPCYDGYPASELINKGYEIPHVIGLLWDKRLISKQEAEIIKRIMMLSADHGPCVSGALGTIIAACAGIGMSQSVAAGLIMIGPRFGGAVTDAGRWFKHAVDNKMSVDDFLAYMKKTVGPVPGIGHRVKSVRNPDKRVQELVGYVKSLGIPTPHLDFALEVEKVTSSKKENLILNVDGTMAAVLVDLGFPVDSLNGFFILSRTIGLIGHWVDQKRQDSRLIRLFDYLVNYAAPKRREVPPLK